MASLYTILETPEILEHLMAFWPKDRFYKEVTAITQELRIKWILQRTDIIYNGSVTARYMMAPLARVQVVLGQGRPAVTEPRLLPYD